MAAVVIQKSLDVRIKPAAFLQCLQDPYFWTYLPTTYRMIDVSRRPLAIGDSVRPSIEPYRLVEVERDSITLRSPILSLRYTAEQAAEAESSRVTLDISVEDPCRCTKVLLDETDKTFLAMAELFEKQPHYGWLPALQMQFESEGAGLKVNLAASIVLPFPSVEVEDALVRQPLEFAKWIDPDMQKGTMRLDGDWPSIGAKVHYSYPREFWFLPPFGRNNVGTVRLEAWAPGQRVVLSDRTEPGGVRTDRTFDLEAGEPGTTLLKMRETSEVNTWITRTFVGRFIRHTIPVEASKSLCEFAGVVARLHPRLELLSL